MEETLQQSWDDRQRALQVSSPGEAPAVPGYRLDTRLGQGSFGEVWSGIQLRTGQKVAVKLCLTSRLDRVQTLRELERLREVADHPSVVTLLDADLEHDPPYLVMPLLTRSLAQLGQPPTPPQVAQWLEQVASGLKHTHDKGILHCDIKPSNVALDEGGRAVLLDFGQARQSGEGRTSWGTQGYMPPEQAGGSERPGVRWDVYALGASFYRLLTGHLPYLEPDELQNVSEVATLEERMRSYRQLLLRGRLVPLRQLRPDVDQDLSDILEACLALDPRCRTATVAQILDDLERSRSGEPLLCRRPWALSYSLGKRLRRPLVRLSLVLTLLLVVGGVAAYRSLRLAYGELQIRSRHNEELLATLARERGDERMAQGSQEEARLWWARALQYRPQDQGLRLALGLPSPKLVGRWPASGLAVSSACPLWALWRGREVQIFQTQMDEPQAVLRFGNPVEQVVFHPQQSSLGVILRLDGGGYGFQWFHEQGRPLGQIFTIPAADAALTVESKLAVFSRSRGISLWDPAEGRALLRKELPLYSKISGYRADSVLQGRSDILACQVDRDAFRLFQASTGQPRSGTLAISGTHSLEVSPDGSTVAMDGDAGVRIYWRGIRRSDYPGARLLATNDAEVVVAEPGRLRILEEDPGEERVLMQPRLPRRVVSGRSGNLAMLFDSHATLHDPASLLQHSLRLPGLRFGLFSSDGSHFLACSSGQVACWQLPPAFCGRRVAVGDSNLWQLCFHPREGWLAALSAGQVSLWRPADGKLLKRFALNGSSRWMALHPEAGLAVLSSSELCYWAYPMRDEQPQRPNWQGLEGGQPQLQALDFSPDGRWLAVLETQGVLLYRCGPNGLQSPRLLACPNPRQVRFSPDGQWLGVVAEFSRGFREARLWSCQGEPADWKPQALPEAALGEPRQLEFSVDGRWLCTSLGSQTLVRQLPQGSVELRLPGNHSMLGFHPERAQLALGSVQHLDLLSLPEGRALWQGLRHPKASAGEYRRHLAWAASGQFLADTTLMGSELWDLATGRLALPYLEEPSTSCLAFSPDESLLAVGTERGELLLYPLPRVRSSGPALQSQVERESGWRLDEQGRMIEL